MLTTEQAAERLGISPRRVQELCVMGEIADAQRFAGVWMIPAPPRRTVDRPRGRPLMSKGARK